MAYPPFYSSFTPPFYSFHHQAGVINFTHLCSPSPNLHSQDLNPIPAPSHHLHYNLAPYGFNCIDTVTVTTPQISQTSFHQLPTLTNSTNLNHSFSYQQYQDPIPPPDLPSLQTNIEPLFLVPPVKRDDEGKSQARITGSKFSTIADEKNFSEKIEKEKNNDASVFSSPIRKNATQTEKSKELATCGSIVSTTANGKSQEITAAEEEGLETEPLQVPPSITQSIPQYFLHSCDSDSIASLSTISVCESDLGFTGSKPCFDLVFLASNPIRSSCFELETVAWETTVPSPAKTKGNAILVFDPGGGCDSGGAPPRDNSYFKWRRESSAYGGSGGSSSTMATRPPATASFPVKEPPPGPASALPWVPWDFGTQDES